MNTPTALPSSARSSALGALLVLAIAVPAPAAKKSNVTFLGPDTQVLQNQPYVDYSNPLTGGEAVAGCRIVQWLDAGLRCVGGNPDFEDWTVSHPCGACGCNCAGSNCIDGYANEIWMRSAGQSVTATSTVPSSMVSVHLHGDVNDGVARVYVDGVLRAEIDMYTAFPGSDSLIVVVSNLPVGTHTIEVEAAGVGAGNDPDVALLGAAVLVCDSISFSIDYGGPTRGTADCGAAGTILESDVLTPCTPSGGAAIPPPLLAQPSISISGGAGGLGLAQHGACDDPAAGQPCSIEVDALSFGRDGPLAQIDYPAGKVLFSVDNFAQGVPGMPSPPNVRTEGVGLTGDAAADVFGDLGLAFSGFPATPAVAFTGNNGVLDGNGTVSLGGFAYPGLGLVEPTNQGPPPNTGDNLDALELGDTLAGQFPVGGVLFSLDVASAAAHGFAGGDVLWTVAPGGPPIVYAPANALGLDLAGAGTDDLDALAVWENGMAGWQQSDSPFDWNGGFTDMVLFSVRRGSAVIGTADSLRGIPIEEGDVLAPPLFALAPPAIVIPAEALGLPTARTHGLPQGDDLDALDVRDTTPTLIAHGTCYGVVCPCGNSDPLAGCANSTGQGGLLVPGGTSSVANDDLVLTGTHLPPNNNGLYYMGDTPVMSFFYDGNQCALGATFRFLGSIQSTGASGTMSYTGWVAASGGLITPGSTWYFHAWHRDVSPVGPCGTGANLTNVVAVQFIP